MTSGRVVVRLSVWSRLGLVLVVASKLLPQTVRIDTTMKFLQYPRCSTCRKAKAYLVSREVSFTAVDLVTETPSAAELADLIARSGLPLRRFFNTSGGSYRAGGFKERLPEMSESEAIAALAADGMLIKRPILDAGSSVLVGFKEAEYAALVG